jgi:hypothetical protein
MEKLVIVDEELWGSMEDYHTRRPNTPSMNYFFGNPLWSRLFTFFWGGVVVNSTYG